MTETKIVELIIQDENQELAIDAISLVTSPAIESEFVFFGKEKNNLTFAKVDEEKRMLISPALIPNKQIFRHDPNTDSDYYVFFSKATVRKASELYLKHNNHHKATYQHQDRVSGVLTVESWIKEGDSDKSKLYGYDLPNGTWFVKMKIENDELWQKIRSGELKGLSIEGYFTNKFEQMQKKEFTNEEVKTALKELLSVQKVELGLVDDLEKAIEKLSNLRDSYYRLNKDALILQKKIKPLLQEKKELTEVAKGNPSFVKKAEANIKKSFNELSKSAAELGISVNKLPVYKKYESAKTLLKEIEGFNKDAKSILAKLN